MATQAGAPVMMAVSYACSCTLPYSPEGAKAGPLHHTQHAWYKEEKCMQGTLPNLALVAVCSDQSTCITCCFTDLAVLHA